MNETLVTIHDYYKAFSTVELDARVRFFTLPCMFIGLHRFRAIVSPFVLLQWGLDFLTRRRGVRVLSEELRLRT